MIKDTVTCSFVLDREIYNQYKSAIASRGEDVKENLLKHMIYEIEHKTPNEDTIAAIKEVQEMKKNPHLYKSYNSFSEILEEIELEELQNEVSN